MAAALDYTQWRNFSKVIDRAMIACENSGHSVACYLIVQNGDPRKEVPCCTLVDIRLSQYSGI